MATACTKSILDLPRFARPVAAWVEAAAFHRAAIRRVSIRVWKRTKKDYMFSGRQRNGKAAVIGGGGIASNGVALTMTQYTTGADPGGITVGDLNGDGRGDICVTSTTNGTVAILLQDPGSPGDFLPAIVIPIGNAPTRITAVDFDNDGHQDLAAIVTSGAGDLLVRVLQGDGSLGFTSLDTAEGEWVALVSDGDINGDGQSELVTIGGGPALRSRGGLPALTLRENKRDMPGRLRCKRRRERR